MFRLVQDHKWNLGDLENMLPWERDVYVDILIADIKQKNEEMKKRMRRR